MSSVPPSPPPSYSPPPGSPSSWGGGDPPRPRLARRSTDKVLGGVCVGLADHLGIDVAVVRVAAVLLAMTGWGIIIYLVAWAALPVSDAPRPPRRHGGRPKGKIPWLPIVIAVALMFTLPSGFSLIFGHGNLGNAEAAVPILLLGGVAYLMWLATRGELPGRRGGPHGPPRYTTPPDTTQGWVAPPPPPPSTPLATRSGPGPAPAGSPERDPAAATDPPLWLRDAAPPAGPSEPAGGAGDDPDEDPLLAEARRLSDPFLNEPLLFETAPTADSAPDVPALPPNRRGAGRAALAALLIGAGAVGLAWALGVSLSPLTVLAGLLIAFGVALVFGGFSGRSSRGLIIPGLIVFGLLSLAAAFNVDLPSGGAGERVYRPTAVSEIPDSYELGLGELTVDLSDVDFRGAGPVEVDAHLGVGELRVIVPQDVDVTVDATAELGEVRVLDEADEGFDVAVSVDDDGAEGAGELVLDIELGVGEVSVDRPEAGAKRPERPETPTVPETPEVPEVPEAPSVP